METFINLVANLGFPIVVAAYLLVRIEGKLDDLSGAIISLREAIIMLPVDQSNASTRFSSMLVNKE